MMRSENSNCNDLVASITFHQPGRAQYERQISQLHASEGGKRW